ncbi:MAG: hypothetical protein R6X34_06615 [Chloroflexota bacterium]
MKIRTEPLLGGAAFSFVILIIVSVISTFAVMGSMQQLMEILLTGAVDPNAAFGSPLLLLVGCLACIAPLIAGIGAGVIYARQYGKYEPVTGSLVSGGAASAALGFFLASVTSGIISSLVMMPVMNDMMALAAQTSGSLVTTGSGLIGNIFGSICGGIVSAVIGAILGAIGAAVGKPKATKPAAP